MTVSDESPPSKSAQNFDEAEIDGHTDRHEEEAEQEAAE